MALTRDEVHQLAREVADLLPDPWEYETPPANDPLMYARIRYGHAPQLESEHDRPALLIYGDGYYHHPGKLNIEGAYPVGLDNRTIHADHDDYRTPAPSIGVGHARGAKVIAREIERRLLPAYLDLHSRRLLAAIREREHAEASEAQTRRLADAFGGSVQDDGNGSWSVRVNRGELYLVARVSGESVSFDRGSCTVDQLMVWAVALRCGAEAS